MSGKGKAPLILSTVAVAGLAGCGSPSLRVMTLNAAHGRGQAAFQGFCRRETIEANLQAVAAVLARERPDLVALQEADGPCLWSGGFDHADRLAELAGFGHRFRGDHVSRSVRGKGLVYGTALLSRLPLAGPASHRFESTFPTPHKGFVVATVALPGSGRLVDVASVHLDFLRDRARQRQVDLLVEKLSGRGRPLVVMGDFNCEWAPPESPLRLVCEGLNLRPFEPEAAGLLTFPAGTPRRRLDWILVSPEIEFVQYDVLPDRVSDHRAVRALIRLRRKE